MFYKYKEIQFLINIVGEKMNTDPYLTPHTIMDSTSPWITYLNEVWECVGI